VFDVIGVINIADDLQRLVDTAAPVDRHAGENDHQRKGDAQARRQPGADRWGGFVGVYLEKWGPMGA